MSNDRFLERLRDEAQQLRWEPRDEAAFGRISARVRERIAAQPTVAQLLAGWFRPVAASMAALAIVTTIGLTLSESTAEPASIEQLSSNTMIVSVDGEVISVDE
jgi:hypothetical protein